MSAGKIKRLIASAYRHAAGTDPTCTAEQAEALAALGRYTWRYALPPAWLRRCVIGIDSDVEEYARALYITERRKVVHEYLPAHGHQRRDEQPLPDPNLYDPWAVDEAELLEKTNVIACCPSCDGAKKVLCGECRGAGRVLCGQCRGGGKVRGERGPKNCPTCRGKGDLRCDFCSRGMVDCRLCDRAGRVETWLTIDKRQYPQVRAYPGNAGMSVHARVLEPTNFDAAHGSWPNKLVEDTGTQMPGTIKVAADLGPQLDPYADRVVSERLQRFASSVHRITYRTILSKGGVELAGTAPRLTGNCDWRPLQIRAGILATSALVALLASFRISAAYRGQSAWHESFGHVGVLEWLLFGVVLATVVTVAGLTLPRRTWSPATTWTPACVAGLFGIAAIVAFFVGGPTKAEAERALNAGDLGLARIVAQSLIDANADPGAGRDMLDQIHLREVFDAGALQAKADKLSEPWFDSAYGEKARANLLESGRAHAERQVESCNADGLDDTARHVALVDPAYATQLKSAAALCRVPQCTNCDCAVGLLESATAVAAPVRDQVRAAAHKAYRDAFDGALTRVGEAQDAATRLTWLTTAIGAAPCVGKLGSPIDGAVLDKLRNDLADAERTIEADRKRAEAEAERQRLAAEAANKREEALQQAREATRRVQCCDGTLSPTCLCSRPSYRGCCSHHQGVCGCE